MLISTLTVSCALHIVLAILPELFLKSATTAKPMVQITNIIQVERSKDNQKKFIVWYVDGENKCLFDYEANKSRDAAEIVARIKYLIVKVVFNETIGTE